MLREFHASYWEKFLLRKMMRNRNRQPVEVVAPRVQQGVGYRGWGECRACTAAVRAAAPLAPLPTAAIVFRAAIKCG